MNRVVAKNLRGTLTHTQTNLSLSLSALSHSHTLGTTLTLTRHLVGAWSPCLQIVVYGGLEFAGDSFGRSKSILGVYDGFGDPADALQL